MGEQGKPMLRRATAALALLVATSLMHCVPVGDWPPRTEAQRRKDKRNACETAAICLILLNEEIQAGKRACLEKKQTDPSRNCEEYSIWPAGGHCGGDCYLIF